MVRLYKKVTRYLNLIDIEGDIIIETTLKSTSIWIEVVVKDDDNLRNSTANTTPCFSDIIPVEPVNFHNSTGMIIVEPSVNIDDAAVIDRDNNEDRETEEIVTVSPHH